MLGYMINKLHLVSNIVGEKILKHADGVDGAVRWGASINLIRAEALQEAFQSKRNVCYKPRGSLQSSYIRPIASCVSVFFFALATRTEFWL